ncbi:expressed unknown protein [Seminavis robusta]|uniref:Uncharacterized protein n=1 Tax=Seminavis robusta TaxID=568900 RepID=A0A9N8E249_9STRA|nr:expressed unknown protein [Seminavis robusta]|eukprot:Sro541_g163250.1 n/a (244) ;mRNA; r:49967-50698
MYGSTMAQPQPQEPGESTSLGAPCVVVGQDDSNPPTTASSPTKISMSFDQADESAVAVGSSFPPLLLPLVPEKSPVAWTVVNNSLAISGCVLIVDMVYAKGQLDERPFATAFYLIWEFLTCFFWTLETSLSATYQYYYLETQQLAWYTKLEIVIAAYFTGTTFWMLYQWNVMNQPIENDKVGEIILDTSFYIYLAARSCTRATSAEEEQQQQQQTDGSPDCESASYLIMSNGNHNDNPGGTFA